jgi:GTP-binding protein Era
VAFVGRPNVGKSSLINAILGARAALVSPKPQTTRNAVRCIYSGEGVQMVLVDTPGDRCSPKSRLDKFLVSAIDAALKDADAVCWVIERDSLGKPPDMDIAARLAAARCPVVLVVNKCDEGRQPGEDVFTPWEALAGSNKARFAVSARTGAGVRELVAFLLSLMPEGEPLYDSDVLIDGTERFMAAEALRGACLRCLRDEVPHCVAVEIDEYKSPDEYPSQKKLYVRASLIVETDGQKAIAIGAGGGMLKKIGRSARADLEDITGFPVYLDLWVKVSPGWRESEAALRRFGYAARLGG